jgi:hypothetical protein
VVLFPNTQGGCQQPQPCQTLNSPCITFYWVGAGAQSVSYNYALSGQPQATATVNFNVSGPTGQDQTTPPPFGTVGLLPPPNFVSATNPALELGGSAANLGIKFTISATPPGTNSGAFSFVQIVTKSPVQRRVGAQSPLCSLGTGLDKSYPYGMDPNDPSSTNDNPGVPLQAGDAETAFSFAATMYLMWSPSPASACAAGSACAIPVPLGLWNWSWGGDAINTLDPGQGPQGWLPIAGGCSAPTATKFQPSTQYPAWTTQTHAGSCN